MISESANLPNRYSALCWRPVTHAQTWVSYSALYLCTVLIRKTLDWSNLWQLPFNTSKCSVMHLGRNNNHYSYTVSSQVLDVVKEVKDLRVFLTADMRPSRHCEEAYSKASRILGMIARTITDRSQEVLIPLYKSVVRPHLEYCSPIWQSCCPRGLALASRILEDTSWRSRPWPWPWHLRPWPWPWPWEKSLGLGLGKAKAKTFPPRSRPRGCCTCMLCSHSQCHMTVCHFLFRNVSQTCM